MLAHICSTLSKWNSPEIDLDTDLSIDELEAEDP